MIDKTEEQFAKINQMFEEFKLNTITKDEFLSGIEDKADKEEIANIVSSTFLHPKLAKLSEPEISSLLSGRTKLNCTKE